MIVIITVHAVSPSFSHFLFDQNPFQPPGWASSGSIWSSLSKAQVRARSVGREIVGCFLPVICKWFVSAQVEVCIREFDSWASGMR